MEKADPTDMAAVGTTVSPSVRAQVAASHAASQAQQRGFLVRVAEVQALGLDLHLDLQAAVCPGGAE